jgi:hypothetical protein
MAENGGKCLLASFGENAISRPFSAVFSRFLPSYAIFDLGNTPSWLVNLRFYKRDADLTDPGPSQTWLFIDEREDYSNYPSFEVTMDGWPDQPQKYRFTDLPASYHGRAAGMSYTDGHSEIRRWRDPRTVPPFVPPHVGGLPPSDFVNCPNNPDVAWLQERTTRPK